VSSAVVFGISLGASRPRLALRLAGVTQCLMLG